MPIADLAPRRIGGSRPVLWAIFLTLLVAAPWLPAGYIFGTDWPGPRRFDFPTVLSSSAPLETMLAAVSRVANGELTGKLFVFGLLFAAALMAFRAAPVDGFVPRAVASTLYVFNPFVFGRLHYGQLFVLGGYALLPWVAIRLRALLVQPTVKTGLLLALSLALVGVVSTHTFLIAGALVTALLVTHLFAAAKPFDYLFRAGRSVVIAAVATLVVSSYWIVPLLLGRGPIAQAVGGFPTTDLRVFAAVPDRQLGLIPNLLGLYGFWAESSGRFTSMKAFAPIWPVLLGLMLLVAAIGAAWAFRQRQLRLGAWVAGLLLAAAIALILEMGVSSPATRGFVTWLDANIPLYRGMRDAGKWAALLALVYSQLIGLGTAAILGWIRSHPRAAPATAWLGTVAAGLLLVLPLYYGNGLLFGMHGEIKPSQYPSGWYAADRLLNSDPHPGRALFLPWHEYMSYSFIQNQNSIVASPAPAFFSIPVLVSADPEVTGTPPPTDPAQVAITALVSAGNQGDWASVLTNLNIKYVLLARDGDWLNFRFLDTQAGLAKVADFGSIVLYRNEGLVQARAPSGAAQMSLFVGR